MNEQNVKDFVYYGAEKYSSIELLRQMVPFCYLYLPFFAWVQALWEMYLHLESLEQQSHCVIRFLYTHFTYGALSHRFPAVLRPMRWA